MSFGLKLQTVMAWTVCCILLSGLVLDLSVSQETGYVPLNTTKGPILGLRYNPNSRTGASYDAFLGIPYGQIPARFQPPVARSSWNDILKTQTDGPVCPQPSVVFSEDCLYLNVFTPVNASFSPTKYPVVAYIHGSAFTAGSSSSKWFGPDFIVPQGVILVTMNYRMGAAGFLTLGSSLAPGNLGLLDTQLALRWIQEEISVFGGDPKQVTLAGHSAGSAMTMFHYLSNTSSAMFQRAIAHSGSALATWAHVTADEGVRRAKLLAEAVGCDKNLNDTQLLICLQTANISTIVEKQNITLCVENLASANQLPFVPVIDTSFGKPAFFTDSIENLLRAATNRSKPLMSGFTTEEGIFLFAYDIWKLVESNLKGFIPWRIEGQLSDQQKPTLEKRVRSKYFPESVSESKVLDIINLYTDYAFKYPAIDVMKSLNLPNITYGYVFAYNGGWAAPLPSIMGQFHVTGVSHGADQSYLFYRGQDLNSCTSNKWNLIVSYVMVKSWTSFVKTGVPDVSGQWGPLSQGKYLMIDSTLSEVNSTDVEEQHYSFWANLTTSSLPSSAVTTKINTVFIFLTLIVIKL